MLKKHVLTILACCLLTPLPGYAQSRAVSLHNLMNGWAWLVRINYHGRIELQSLINVQPPDGHHHMTLTAINFPGGSAPAGASIDQVRNLSWRLQPESTLMIHDSRGQTNYFAYEDGYSVQHMGIQSRSDVMQLADCLSNPQASHAPFWLQNVHSFTGMISGMLDINVRRGLLNTRQSGSIFTPAITAGHHLGARSQYNPHLHDFNHMVYSTYGPSGDLRKPDPAVRQNNNLTVMQVASTPHTGACSLFLSPLGIITATLDATGNTVMLISHPLVIFFRWITGMCRPDEDCANPANWDPGNTDRQINNLPLPLLRD